MDVVEEVAILDTTTTSIDLAELLSTCIDACRRGCEVIRNVRHKSLLLLHGDDTSNNNLLLLDAVHYKIPDDPRSALTEADGASQKVIIECLSRCWEQHIKSGQIKIVGEEEDEHSTDLEEECDDNDNNSFDTNYSEDIMSHFDNYNCPRPDLEPIQRDMFVKLLVSPSTNNDDCRRRDLPEKTYDEINHNSHNCSKQENSNSSSSSSSSSSMAGQNDEIIIFIDPMDGTREFVEGRIQHVQCLIGITVNGVPVAGAMGMPMVHDHQIEIAYGLISPQKKKKTTTTTTENNEESAFGSISTVPILSGVQFFDSINPLTIIPTPRTEDRVVSDDDAGNDNDDGALLLFSGDSMKPALNLAMDCLQNQILRGAERGIKAVNVLQNEQGVNMHPPIRKIVAGGCGHKILSLQRHVQSIILRHAQDEEKYTTVGAISIGPPGSSSWDTAAPTAVLLAVDPNARVTDLLGQPLIYDGENLSNKLGVVVSSGYVATKIHEALCMKLCQDEALHEVLGVKSSQPHSTALDA